MADIGEPTGRTAGTAVRAEHGGGSAQRAAAVAGDGHRRQGRGDQHRRRDGRSGRHLAGVVQEADHGGARPRLPLADREARAAQRVSSGCSTGRSTRTCWSSGCTTWCPKRSGRVATRQINEFEKRLADNQVTIVKCFLHISRDGPVRAAAGPAGRPDEVLEVQPGRHRRARILGLLPAGLFGGDRSLQYRARAVARHPVRPEVVPELGDRGVADRGPGDDRPGLPTARRSTSRPRSAGSRKADHGGRGRRCGSRSARSRCPVGRADRGGDNGPVHLITPRDRLDAARAAQGQRPRQEPDRGRPRAAPAGSPCHGAGHGRRRIRRARRAGGGGGGRGSGRRRPVGAACPACGFS